MLFLPPFCCRLAEAVKSLQVFQEFVAASRADVSLYKFRRNQFSRFVGVISEKVISYYRNICLRHTNMLEHVAGTVLMTICNLSLTSAEFADTTIVFSIPVTAGQQQQQSALVTLTYVC